MCLSVVAASGSLLSLPSYFAEVSFQVPTSLLSAFASSAVDRVPAIENAKAATRPSIPSLRINLLLMVETLEMECRRYQTTSVRSRRARNDHRLAGDLS